MLEANDLSFGYNDDVLFSGVSLHVPRGTSLAILGPSGVGRRASGVGRRASGVGRRASGVGKSSLLSIIGGQLSPRTGVVHLDGKVLSARRSQTSVAWIIQSLNVLRRRTALANATLLGLIEGNHPDAVRTKAETVLSDLGLGDLTQRRVSDLSGGETQRVTIARAVVSNRPVILADEPTNQLDAERAARVIRLLITEAAEADRILIVVTHDEAIARRCDRTLRLATT